MTTIDLLITILGILGTICGIVFGYSTFGYRRRKEEQNDGKKDGVLLTEVGYIKSGIDDIKRKQEKQDEQHLEVITRLASVEESIKQAHLRIDKVERENKS